MLSSRHNGQGRAGRAADVRRRGGGGGGQQTLGGGEGGGSIGGEVGTVWAGKGGGNSPFSHFYYSAN